MSGSGGATAAELLKDPVLRKAIERLADDVGSRLHSVVLYGSAARGDFDKATSDFNLIIVLEDLEPGTLETLSPALTRWERQRQPLPRIFSLEVIREAADVFPIEFLDIRHDRVVLHGHDPFADLEIHTAHLRLQCERELREKLMRLREAYVGAHGRPRELTRLLTSSYSSFVALFRGCLHLLGEDVPVHNDEVVGAFGAIAELDRSPFDEIARLKHGEKGETDPKALFSRYYAELTKAVHRVNRFEVAAGGRTG